MKDQRERMSRYDMARHLALNEPEVVVLIVYTLFVGVLVLWIL